MLAELEALRARTCVRPLSLAAIHAGLGDADAAQEEFAAAISERCRSPPRVRLAQESGARSLVHSSPTHYWRLRR